MSTKTISQSWSKMLDIFNVSQNIDLHLRKRRRIKFLSHFRLPQKGSLLDISCGCGCVLDIFRDISPKLHFYGIDMSQNAIKKAKKNYPWGKFSQGLAQYLPYQKNKFSVIISCNAFHHYNQPEKVLDEVSRVMANGGTFYIKDIFPKHRIAQWFQNYHGCSEPYHFEKYYTKKDIESLAESKGFFINAYTKSGLFSNIQVIALKKYEQGIY